MKTKNMSPDFQQPPTLSLREPLFTDYSEKLKQVPIGTISTLKGIFNGMNTDFERDT